MTDIIIKDEKFDILDKDCEDFEPLPDGTISGEKKYCKLSFECKQIGMKSDFTQLLDPKTGEILTWDYLCTGKEPVWEERSDEEEAN